jgi:hypothetical protein
MYSKMFSGTALDVEHASHYLVKVHKLGHNHLQKTAATDTMYAITSFYRLLSTPVTVQLTLFADQEEGAACILLSFEKPRPCEDIRDEVGCIFEGAKIMAVLAVPQENKVEWVKTLIQLFKLSTTTAQYGISDTETQDVRTSEQGEGDTRALMEVEAED